MKTMMMSALHDSTHIQDVPKHRPFLIVDYSAMVSGRKACDIIIYFILLIEHELDIDKSSGSTTRFAKTLSALLKT